MKMQNNIRSIVLNLLLCSLALSAYGQDFPEPMKPPRLVNDYAGVLSDGEFQALESKLRRYEDTTSNQIAIAIISSTGMYDISQYTVELGEKWGVGEKGKDNGILILAAIDDRNIWISTGYGLEPTVTDVATRRIIQDYIIPNFREGRYYEGFDEATTIIIKLAEGEFKAEDLGAAESEQAPGGSVIIFLLSIIFIGIISFSRYRRMAKHHYGNDAGFWAILALMMSSGGRRGGSSWNDFSGGTGSFGGGGGFGGFGGGSFGGGGAGGSW